MVVLVHHDLCTLFVFSMNITVVMWSTKIETLGDVSRLLAIGLLQIFKLCTQNTAALFLWSL
jgi:hypothetical protein